MTHRENLRIQSRPGEDSAEADREGPHSCGGQILGEEGQTHQQTRKLSPGDGGYETAHYHGE